ncbi:MAG: FAD-binding oxidoreductase [Candidatus Omnitrophota bacterium]
MIEFETEVADIIERTPTVKSFRFNVKQEADFKPGQFFFLTIKVGGIEKMKHFSFSNSPTEKGYLEFTKRLTDSEFSNALDGLKTGDWAKIKMPLGRFIFEGEYEKIAFLTGGIGITPIMSMCKFIVDKRLPTDAVVFYSNRTKEETAFMDELDKMVIQSEKIRVVYTMTSGEIDKKGWRGRTGYIDEKMVREEIPDFAERVFYICGPPPMVEAMSALLKNGLRLSQDKIKVENFTGY